MIGAMEFFIKLLRLGNVYRHATYPGVRVNIPGWGAVGLRPFSKSGSPAIDVDIPKIPQVERIHFT
jgi:hypothetical protein